MTISYVRFWLAGIPHFFEDNFEDNDSNRFNADGGPENLTVFFTP